MYKPTNREKQLAPRKGKYWCTPCDKAMVHPGGRCPNCGKKEAKRRFKK